MQARTANGAPPSVLSSATVMAAQNNAAFSLQLHSALDKNNNMFDAERRRELLLNQINKRLSKKNLEEFLKSEPYYMCICTLRRVERKLNPISKMRIILRASE
jgi:hypothetical protein